MYFIKHAKKGILELLVPFAAIGAAWIIGTIYLNQKVEFHGFWLGALNVFLWVMAVCFPLAFVMLIWDAATKTPERARKIAHTLSHIVSVRIERGAQALRKRVAAGNSGIDQARILLQDIALALGIGVEIDEIEMLLKKGRGAKLSIIYDALYFEKKEEDPQTFAVKIIEPEHGLLRLAYEVNGNAQAVDLTIWTDSK